MRESDNPLLTAVMLAIKGNLIDFNLKDSQEISSEIDRIASHNFDLGAICSNKHFNYQYFYQYLLKSKYILYLADNAGEVVFDRILIEQLVDDYKKNILYVVKGKPALNNALVDDAIYCGINNIAKVISCGADCPGVLLEECSSEFMRLFEEAEMIISKGQGNYEALSEESSPIFFLLIAKCPVIAKHIGCGIGDFILQNKSLKLEIDSSGEANKGKEKENISG